MSRPLSAGEQGIAKIIKATEELARQWQAGNSAASRVTLSGLWPRSRQQNSSACVSQSSAVEWGLDPI